MLKNMIVFLIGIIFSLGLGLSGMTDPQKVLGFLDVFGHWDPSLVFVMGAGIPIYFVFWHFFKNRTHPLLEARLHLPTSIRVDKKLVIGSAIFGVGWGLAGICPGPGIAAVGAFSLGAVVFLVMYFVGTYIEKKLDRWF